MEDYSDAAVVTRARKKNKAVIRRNIFRKADNVLRRLMDIILSLIGMVILSPVFLLIAIAIKRSSPGPIFYWGPRAGRHGTTFRILKFRTMFEREESYQGPKVTAENDPRITPLGRMLRQTKMNELPQLWNVLIGDMSLVGPRPEDPTIAAAWPEEVRNEILSVRPGITSPASVVYRNEEELLESQNLMDTYLWDILPTKLRLDQLYVRNRSVLSDMDVVLWTLIALVPKLKSYAVPEHLLYWGPFSRFTSRILYWFAIDLIVAFVAIGTAGVIRRLSAPLDLGLDTAVLIALIMALLFSLLNTVVGLNRVNWSTARMQDAFDLAVSTGILSLLIFVANMALPGDPLLPPSVVVLSGVFAFFGFVAVRYRSRLFIDLASRWMDMKGHRLLGERVLIIGGGEVGRFASWLLRNETLSQAFHIVGMVDDDPRKIGTTIDGCAVIDSTDSIPYLVQKHDIGLIMYAIADIDPAEQERILTLCQSTSARTIPIPDILETLRAQLPKNESERNELFNKVVDNATTDRLTGAYNRQYFLKLAEVEQVRARRYGRPLSLMMLSIDYERPKRSRKSHTTNARVMTEAARKCLENIRGIDLLGRYRANYLMILLPETDQEASKMVLQRIVQAITGSPVTTDRGPVMVIVKHTITTVYPDEERSFEDMLRQEYEELSLEVDLEDLKERKIREPVRGETTSKVSQKDRIGWTRRETSH